MPSNFYIANKLSCTPPQSGALENLQTAQVQKLITELEGRNLTVCIKAATALGRMGPEAKLATVALANVLKTHTDESMLYTVAWALGEIGPDAIAAESAFIEVLEKKTSKNSEFYKTDLHIQLAGSLLKIVGEERYRSLRKEQIPSL